MAIVKMDKFNLLSFEYNRSTLLDILQDFNYVHLNDLQVLEDEDYVKEVKNSETIAKIEEKITKHKFIEENIKKFKKEEKSDKDLEGLQTLSLEEVNNRAKEFDFEGLFQKVKDLVEKRDKLVQTNQNLQSHINEIEPWQEISFDMKDLYASKRFFLDTGMVPKSYYENFKENLLTSGLKTPTVRKISEVNGNVYLIVLSTNDEKEDFKEFLRENGFSRVRITENGSISQAIKKSRSDKEENEKKILEFEKEIASLKKYIPELGVYYTYLLNLKKKEESSEFFLKTKKMDYIEGYVPSDMVEKFKTDLDKSLGKNSYALSCKSAEKDDEKVPIILENNKLIRPFESVVSTYALPKYNELDPTPLIAPFYAIFTGFMIGDLGYGLIAVLGCLFALNKLKLSQESKKMVRLVLWMGASSSVFGLIFGSIFGGIVPIPALIDTQKDFNTLIILSLIIAFIAMFFALGIKAYMLIRDGKVLDAVFDVGFWYMAVGGAIFFLLAKQEFLSGINPGISKWIMIIGMLGIVLTGGREGKSVGAKAAIGLYDLYGISSWIGDFVSFLRLMALVLSGGFVAYAVNMIVRMVAGSGGFVGFIFGTIIFIIFQLFNMFLSFLSGYVHSLRLVYVEMFNKFYEGGGNKFREMVEDTKFVDVIRGGKQ